MFMKRYIIFIVCALAGFHSCLDIKLENQFSDPYAITTVSTARELLASAYNSLPRYQFELSLMSDDFTPTSLASSATNLQNIYKWSEKDLVELSSLIWNEYYLTIAYLNALLPRLANVVTESEADAAELEKVRAEALTMKAYCYFDLLRLYAPAYSEANLDKAGIIIKNRLELDFLPRSSVRTCVTEIENLLNEAAEIPNENAPVYYLGSTALAALRTEFELWRGNYSKAVEYGLPLLADIEERLSGTEWDKLWSSDDSRERIFAPYIFNSFYTNLNDSRTSGDYFKLSDEIVYGEGDLRKEWGEFQGPMAGARSFGKYNKMFFDQIEVRYINILRYSGVLFCVAEAYTKTAEGEVQARVLLNKYLTARGLEETSEELQGETLTARILHEKHKEFVGEGIRFFDLKRMGGPLKRYDARGVTENTIQADDYRWLLPIPQSEYKYNENITETDQNPGWPYEKTN